MASHLPLLFTSTAHIRHHASSVAILAPAFRACAVWQSFLWPPISGCLYTISSAPLRRMMNCFFITDNIYCRRPCSMRQPPKHAKANGEQFSSQINVGQCVIQAFRLAALIRNNRKRHTHHTQVPINSGTLRGLWPLHHKCQIINIF